MNEETTTKMIKEDGGKYATFRIYAVEGVEAKLRHRDVRA